jgi:hypothetical protein
MESSNRGVVDELCINTIRTLAIDAVQQANSGHPGTPMALAPVAYTLCNFNGVAGSAAKIVGVSDDRWLRAGTPTNF